METKEKEISWKNYLEYLKKWSDEHCDDMYYGMSPAGFPEWEKNEALY